MARKPRPDAKNALNNQADNKGAPHSGKLSGAKLQSILDAAQNVAGKLPSLTLQVERVAHTPILGTHGRRRAGVGEAFWEFEEYDPERHEMRQIDWRQSMRHEDKTFVRIKEWEASQAAYIWVDNAPEMGFSGAPQTRRTKGETAQIMALGLATVLCKAEERVALLGAEGAKLTSRLDNMIDAFQNRPAEDAESWQKLGRDGRPPLRNATVILISDFMEDPEIIKAALKRLADHNITGHLIQVLDPDEVNLPYDGHIEFDDYRGGNLRLPKVQDVRREYFDRLHAHQLKLTKIAHDAGWGFSCHTTDKRIEDALTPLYNAVPPALPTFNDTASSAPPPAQKRSLWQRLRFG